MKAELAVKMRTTLGEGPIWDQRIDALYWVDILGGTLFRTWPQRNYETEQFEIGQAAGTVVPADDGGVLLALANGFAGYDCDQRKLRLFANPEIGKPGNRFNDGKCDPRGRMVAGTMAFDAADGAGALYRFDADHSVHTLLADLSIPNGMTWSRDGTRFYFSDTPERVVRVYDYDLDTGAIANCRVAFETPEGMGWPDGMTIDTDGLLWVAHHDEGIVRRWDPQTGKPDVEIEVAAAKVTACWFGDRDRQTLYITSASQQMSDEQLREQPLAGSLFAVRLPQQGLPTHRYAGATR